MKRHILRAACVLAALALHVGTATAAAPAVRASVDGDVFCTLGATPCYPPSYDLDFFGRGDGDPDGDGVASASYGGRNSDARSAVDEPAGRLSTSASGGEIVPAGGAGSIQLFGRAQIDDTITVLSPARLTLRGGASLRGTMRAHVVVSRFEPAPGGECCELVFGEIDTDADRAFAIPLDLPAGTFDFRAELLGSVDERAEGGESASGSFAGELTFALDVPSGVVATSGSGRLPLLGGSPPPPAGNTPAGSAVAVTPVDPVSGGSPATITFAHVTAPGETTITSTTTAPPGPVGFQVLGSYYELATTAQWDSAEVCFAYTSAPAPQIAHHESGAWRILAPTRDTGAAVCATVTSFSPFALVRAKSAQEQLADLVAKVVAASALPPAAKSLLLAKLQALVAGFDPANAAQRHAVCVALALFKAAVQLQAGRTIPAAQAAEWIADANRLRAVLAC